MLILYLDAPRHNALELQGHITILPAPFIKVSNNDNEIFPSCLTHLVQVFIGGVSYAYIIFAIIFGVPKVKRQ